MKAKTIRVVLDNGAYMPEHAHKLDAGYDLKTPMAFSLGGGESISINTGVHMEIPKGYVGFLKSKSGLNVKNAITGEGVIDAGYTGPIVVKLYKDISQKELKLFASGDKIIQIVIVPFIAPELEIVDSLEATERGDNGFGSTGR